MTCGFICNPKINVPPGQEAFIWLTYEEQLSRSNSSYKYKTNFKTFENVENIQIFVKIHESRNLKNAFARVNAPGLAGGDAQTISPNETNFEFFGENVEIDGKVEIEYDVERPSFLGGDIIIRNG